MESGVPMFNCLLQQTLRSLCTFSSDSSNSNTSKWVYAVFWRILPRNYPPPKWDHGGSLLDRAKGNKRNWILVWEDGFCDFCECERAGNGYMKGRFGADVFFKMTHEVYNFGEGLVGKIASDNSHKWVFRDSPTENDPSSLISSWNNVSIDHQPRAWEAQFSSGIETIAIISVREGAIQLGSFDKVIEDINEVLSIQRKFNYLHTIPGIYSIQRPYLSIQNANFFDYNNSNVMIGSERQNYEEFNGSPTKSMYLGYNTPHNSLPLMSIPPLLPSMTCNLGTFISKVPHISGAYDYDDHRHTLLNGLRSGASQNVNVARFDDEIHRDDVIKVEASCGHEEKPNTLNETLRLEDGVVDLGFESLSEERRNVVNLN